MNVENATYTAAAQKRLVKIALKAECDWRAVYHYKSLQSKLSEAETQLSKEPSDVVQRKSVIVGTGNYYDFFIVLCGKRKIGRTTKDCLITALSCEQDAVVKRVFGADVTVKTVKGCMMYEDDED